MAGIYVDFDESIPRYGCTHCSNCNSLFGTSLCKVKNRGCCFYFPKFTLVDIHNMCQSMEGLQVLFKIIINPGTEIYRYYIHAKGYFDEKGYNKYISEKHYTIDGYVNSCFINYMNELSSVERLHEIQDQTIFFRSCAFVKEGYGCTIPSKYRTYICNLFLCSEVVDSIKHFKSYENYTKERDSYMRWLNWENKNLKHLLRDNSLNLIDNLDHIIKLFQELPLEVYEFPKLEPIESEENLSPNI
ncbi:hypothetical protein [Clostridium amazonitimonense]|uniref:hypothetical protein n=1 Tax=Clostridium amazonitimonense TaxID=1499689 RepID=UPI000509BB29|nr:hypothetical protein [Clostridium amazonitimonense]